MNIFVNTPFYEYLCKNKNLAKLFEPPHKKKKIAEENLHMIVESELRIEMGIRVGQYFRMQKYSVW